MREVRDKAVAKAIGELIYHGIKVRPERPSDNRDVRVFPDGDQWCCMYGENLQEGIAGFGDTPKAACKAFDIEWGVAKMPPTGRGSGQ